MPNKKTIVAATSFLHPVTKKRVLRGSEITDVKGIPEHFLTEKKEDKKKDADK